MRRIFSQFWRIAYLGAGKKHAERMRKVCICNGWMLFCGGCFIALVSVSRGEIQWTALGSACLMALGGAVSVYFGRSDPFRSKRRKECVGSGTRDDRDNGQVEQTGSEE